MRPALFITMMLMLLMSVVDSAAWTREPQVRRQPARPSDNLPLPAWHTLSEIGRGTAVVFSPDLARPANRTFYRRLGFLYIETADWFEVLEGLLNHNRHYPDRLVHTVIMETHGNWGHGLKLQMGKLPTDSRSYISLGALQERLAGSGIKRCIITACNAGRLLRPNIYYRLDERNLLPARYGVINASPGYKAQLSDVRLLRRRESRMEMGNTIMVHELPPLLQKRLGLDDKRVGFVVSDLFLQYVLRDARLRLTDIGYVVAISRQSLPTNASETLITRFLRLLTDVADRNKESVATKSHLLR
ncbi:MAG: hypothetical protein AB1489_10825 [Acidobacteriota bacterium]